MATKIPEKETILGQNPEIDKKLVAAYENLEKELHRLGVDTRTRYTLEIPITEKHKNPVLLIARSRTNSKRGA
ncbi:MAG: hypothetical protein OXD43_08515 [Bacteroidetes bacterium]|nr:hypothetical protein [Bacteroidota bacterium]